MRKYNPKFIKQQKIITWIICIVLAFISIFVIMLNESIYSNLDELHYTIVFCFIILLSCFLTALFTTLSLARNSKKACENIIKEFSLKENEYTEFNYILKDCYNNINMLNEIIDILKLQPRNKDFFYTPKGIKIVRLILSNSRLSTINLLMDLINSMGGKFYLFFNNEKKIFFCVFDLDGNEIYKNEIEDFSELKEENQQTILSYNL